MEDLKFLGKKTPYPKNLAEAELETFENQAQHRPYTVSFNCPEFTNICPVTGQPDFATITITYVPDKKCIESKSLKLYLSSYRNEGMFHETVTNRILDDVIKAIDPFEAQVVGEFKARGGISITVAADHKRDDYYEDNDNCGGGCCH